MAYAIVRAGGRQEKVSKGDLVVLDRLPADVGSSIELPALMLVDGNKITSDKAELEKVTVSAETLEHNHGKRIVIQIHKNKIGYIKRQGHRQNQTREKITDIK